ncbi:uncharacterized protein LOC121008750 [Bufo bufo]|uniref:uncharacterized protein LOC121008750 n=1 Tax=Bufo bufo TaxID=8384 RepID=UPI001ABE35C6|nr:uncharacterized protein LOC121008750 [Bufo bufo]
MSTLGMEPHDSTKGLAIGNISLNFLVERNKKSILPHQRKTSPPKGALVYQWGRPPPLEFERESATSKDYREVISDSELDVLENTMSSMQISEIDESWLNESFEHETIEEDEEMKSLLERLRKKNRAANPGEDYCFQTDPLWSPEEDSSIEEPDPENRLKELHWCNCGQCQILTSVNDCLCCTEIYALESLLTPEINCICKHPRFTEVCQDSDQLIGLITSMQITTGRTMDSKNTRCLCLAAYRAFTMWVHGPLGKHNRRPIPTCAVLKIRALFPDQNGCYTGFHYYQDVPLTQSDLDFNF